MHTQSSFNNFKDTTKYPFDEKLECADSSNDHMKTVSPDKYVCLARMYNP